MRLDRSLRVSGLESHTTVRERDQVLPQVVVVLVPTPPESTRVVWPEAPAQLAQEFSALAGEWHAATDHLSIAAQKTTHPAYLDIIGMGRAAVPLILRQARQDRGDWFAALRHIARGDAAPGTTSIEEAIDAWEQWARREGYL